MEDRYSKYPPEAQKWFVTKIDQRWGQLHAFEKEWSEKAVQFLFLSNAGGAAATLSFLGASDKAFDRAGVKWSLLWFVLGLIFVGFTTAKAYYTASGLFKAYKTEAHKFLEDQIGWDDLRKADDERAEVGWLDHLLPWASFILFGAGCAVGGQSLF